MAQESLQRNISKTRQLCKTWFLDYKSHHGIQWDRFLTELRKAQMEVFVTGRVTNGRDMRNLFQSEAHLQWVYWKHQMRTRWVRLGDSGTTFFYKCVKFRQCRNRI